MLAPRALQSLNYAEMYDIIHIKFAAVPLLPVIISVSVNSNSHIEKNITALTE